MRKYAYLAASAVAVLVVSLTTAGPAAAANTVLTYESPAGPAVNVGDVLTADLVDGTYATFYSTTSGSTGVRCAESSFSATVTANPAVDGIATEDLTDHTFAACTSNVIGVLGVQSIVVENLPYAASVDSVTEEVTVQGKPEKGMIRSTVKLITLLGIITCVYQDADNTMTGATSDIGNTITFINERFNKLSGPSLCFPTAYFSATYGPVTGPGGLVFVN